MSNSLAESRLQKALVQTAESASPLSESCLKKERAGSIAVRDCDFLKCFAGLLLI